MSNADNQDITSAETQAYDESAGMPLPELCRVWRAHKHDANHPNITDHESALLTHREQGIARRITETAATDIKGFAAKLDTMFRCYPDEPNRVSIERSLKRDAARLL